MKKRHDRIAGAYKIDLALADTVWKQTPRNIQDALRVLLLQQIIDEQRELRLKMIFMCGEQ